MATAKQFLAEAAKYIDYKEGQDPDGNWNNDNKFGVWYGMNRVAWCAIFISYVAFKVGVLGTLVPKFASCWHGLKWFRDRELTGHWPPAPGDIFIMREYNPKSWTADPDGWATIHTGIVEKYLGDGRVQTIEGNTNLGGSAQGNGVYRLIRQDSATGKKFIYCRPKWDPEPVVAAPKPVVAAAPKPAPKPVVVVKPKPAAPKPAPIPGAVYSGSRTVRVSNVRPNKRNEDCRRFNGIMWAWLCKNAPAYARANAAAWMKEPADVYGYQSQLATREMYRVLSVLRPHTFKPVTLPTWPGREGVNAIGGSAV